MHITYKPEDGEQQVWEFDPGRIRAGVAEVIEKRFGANFDMWRDGVRAGNAKARRVLLWHLLRQTHATLRYEDTPDFYMDELLVEFSVSELLELRERLERASMDESMREQVRTGLDLEITDAMAREGLGVLPEGGLPKAG